MHKYLGFAFKYFKLFNGFIPAALLIEFKSLIKIAGAQAENRDFVGAKETFLLVEEMADTITDSRTKAGFLSS